jgi:hypothetical protein
MRKAAALMTIAMLGGCGQSGDGGNGLAAAPGTGAGAGAATVSLQPGQWESRLEILNADMPQMPAGAPGMPPMSARFCITPEQAANPNADVLGGGRNNPQGCTTENYTVAGGRISGTIVCAMGGSTNRTTISGQFTPTTYEMTMQSRTDAGGTATDSQTRISARRIGDCPAGQ